jgi:hypothetical protein
MLHFEQMHEAQRRSRAITAAPIWLRLARADCSVVGASPAEVAAAALRGNHGPFLHLHHGTIERAKDALPIHLHHYIDAFIPFVNFSL